MFESISEKFGSIFSRIRGTAKLSEENISQAIRDIRMALLEADVNYKVVKDFVGHVKERSLGEEVTGRVTPGQQFIKIVHDEMVTLLGGAEAKMSLSGAPPVMVMMSGLMGSGKTTTTAKLGAYLKKGGRKILMVAADTQRPAAREQLMSLGDRIGIDVYSTTETDDPVEICQEARSHGAANGYDVVILDTAGRLHVDRELMDELATIKRAVNPAEILLVADAMSGQDAVNAAEEFNAALDLTGVVLTKLDGDARGGAALSIKAVTDRPIKFVGVGEKHEDFVAFDPVRMAGRILGMGDVVSLVEKAQEVVDEKKAKELEKKLRKGAFTLDDFLDQIKSIKKMGSLEGLMGMIPGMKGLPGGVDLTQAESEMKRIEAIINSMTQKERDNHTIINGSRRKRIARGSGTRVEDVNRLLKRYSTMKKMMKKVTKGGLKGISRGNIPF